MVCVDNLTLLSLLQTVATLTKIKHRYYLQPQVTDAALLQFSFFNKKSCNIFVTDDIFVKLQANSLRQTEMDDKPK